MQIPRITFNAPVTLTFFFLALGIMVASMVMPAIMQLLAAVGPPSLSPRYLWGLFTCPLAHADWFHFIGNFSIILLIGPILEEKYGSQFLCVSFLITTVAISLVHTVFFSGGLLGASGLVFFCIMLVSMTNFRKGELPLTLVLVALLYLGKEVSSIFNDDQVSQLGHILGGVCGTTAGYFLRLKQV